MKKNVIKLLSYTSVLALTLNMESMLNCVSNDVDTQKQGEHVSAITASTTEAELMKDPRGVSLNNQMLRSVVRMLISY